MHAVLLAQDHFKVTCTSRAGDKPLVGCRMDVVSHSLSVVEKAHSPLVQPQSQVDILPTGRLELFIEQLILHKRAMQ